MPLMTESMINELQDTYDAAAESVGLPSEWWIDVRTEMEAINLMEHMGAEGFENELDSALVLLVDPGGTAHIIKEHDGPTKKAHAERYILDGLEDHPTQAEMGGD